MHGIKIYRLAFLFFLVCSFPAFALKEKKNASLVLPTQEIRVISFENFRQEKKTTADYFHLRADGEFGLQSKATLTQGYGAPVFNSQSFLTVAYRQKDFLPLHFVFAEPFVSGDFLQSVSLWVYGTKSQGSLQMILRDNNQDAFILFLGVLDFRGWKKLSAKIPANFIQIDKAAQENRTFRIESIFYTPAKIFDSTKFLRRPLVFFIDEITVQVRPKFIWNFTP